MYTKAQHKSVINRIRNAKSLIALNAACKYFAEFRKPNNFEFSIDEYGKPVKYVLDRGAFQSNTKFNSLEEAKDWAELAYTMSNLESEGFEHAKTGNHKSPFGIGA